MKINEVEAAVGVTKKNIRFYEEEGLITPSREPGNGYRSYACAASSCCASWMCLWRRSGKCWRGARRWPRAWPCSWNV